MKRRGFLKGAIAALIAPLSVVTKPEEAPAREEHCAYTIPNCRKLPKHNVICGDHGYADFQARLVDLDRDQRDGLEAGLNYLNGVMPSRDEVVVYENGVITPESLGLHRVEVPVYDNVGPIDWKLPEKPMTEVYGWCEQGHAILDNRKVLLMDFS